MATIDSSMMEQLLHEANRQTRLLQAISENQLLLVQYQGQQTVVLEQLLQETKNQLWFQEESLDTQRIQERRQSVTGPDGNDTWRHGDQVTSGEVWYGSEKIWSNLAAQVALRITSKGQLPAECDLRRGQYMAVQKHLQFHWGSIRV